MLKFYITFVRPILEYGSAVWSPISRFDIDRLESVQRFFTNNISECAFPPYTAHLSKLSLHSLFYRRQIADLCILYSLLSVSLSPHLILLPPTTSRSHNLKILAPVLCLNQSYQNIISRTVTI